MVPIVRDPAASVQLIICGEVDHAEDPFLIKPMPIQVPPLAARADELPRIVDEYAHDAIATLGAFDRDFTDADRELGGRRARRGGRADRAEVQAQAVDDALASGSGLQTSGAVSMEARCQRPASAGCGPAT
jgi:hypothetical protein